MRKIAIAIILLIPFVIMATDASYEGEYYNGYHSVMDSLEAVDTLTATDSVVYYTTFHEQFSDSLYFSLYMRGKESGTQSSNVDIDLQFSPDSASGFSASQALKANLDVGATCDDLWYELPLGTNVNEIYSMKYMKIILNNSDTDQNKLYLKDIGFAFKKKK